MLRILYARGFATRWSKYAIPGMVNEFRDYRKAMKKARKDLKREGAIAQIKAEEKWMKDYAAEQGEKWIRDMDKWRTSVCRIAMHTKRTIDYMMERDRRLAHTHKLANARRAQESFERRLMLDAMEMESKYWPADAKDTEEALKKASFPASFIDDEEYARYYDVVRVLLILGRWVIADRRL